MSNEEILDSANTESCLSLFDDYKLPLVRVPLDQIKGDPELLYCAVVGFSGDQMRGSVLLATSREPLGRTSPTTDASFREWIAELSNQLLGRIKNKLIPRGVTLHLSTPVVLRGQHLAPVTRAELVPVVFNCDDGHVCVWFDCEQNPGLDLSQVNEEAAMITEGESMLF